MSELTKVVVFQLDDQQFGVSIYEMTSIEKLQTITEVPQTASFVKGVINLRGEITPIIDLKERLYGKQTSYTDETKILIVNRNNLQAGLIVDEATDVIDASFTELDPEEEMKEYISGVAAQDDKNVFLLDVDAVLKLEDFNQLV